MDKYTQIVQKISEYSKLSVEEVERKVEAKRAKLSGLVSKEGAAQIVAAELGINFEKEKIKITELMQGMKKANVVGKIIEIYPVRSYNKNGREGKVANLILADETGNARLVLWDTNHINLVETSKLNLGDVVEISNGNVRNGELHLSSFGDIKKSNIQIEKVVEGKTFSEVKIKDAKIGQGIKTRAFIVSIYDPRYFEVCPECGKKAIDGECATHGKIESVKKALINFVLDDGTETMRAIISGENVHKLGFTNEEVFAIDVFNHKKNEVIGDEKIFQGNVKNNIMFNNPELNILDIEEINPDMLLNELEKLK